MMRMCGPGPRGVRRGGCRVAGGGRGGCGGLGGCRLAVYTGLLGARGGLPLFLCARLGGTGARETWGGVGLAKGVCRLLAGVPQQGLRRCLHRRLRAVSREVGEFPYCLWVVCGPWQCGSAVAESVVEVVVPHGLCLRDPGLRWFWCVWTVREFLGPVERRVEGLPRGALAACGSGSLEESLPASAGVLLVYLWGVGLGRHENQGWD